MGVGVVLYCIKNKISKTLGSTSITHHDTFASYRCTMVFDPKVFVIREILDFFKNFSALRVYKSQRESWLFWAIWGPVVFSHACFIDQCAAQSSTVIRGPRKFMPWKHRESFPRTACSQAIHDNCFINVDKSCRGWVGWGSITLETRRIVKLRVKSRENIECAFVKTFWFLITYSPLVQCLITFFCNDMCHWLSGTSLRVCW